MQKHVGLLFLFFLVLSCSPEAKNTVDVSNIDVSYSLKRFDVDFYTSTTDSLSKVKDAYPYFFDAVTPDSVWVNKIQSKDEQALFSEVQKKYSDLSVLEEDITSLLKHIKYYHPSFKTPTVITLLSNVDYQNRVIYSSDYVLIALDLYLGSNHEFYADFPSYIKQNFTRNHILVDIANAIGTRFVPPNKDRTFVAKMVHEGRQLYALDRYLPTFKDATKIGYSDEKLTWAIENEEQVWKYFISEQLLFSTDSKLNARFLELAPFSKFYREEDAKSPGKIGAWIGWQIVRSYMKYNDVSLQKLMNTSPEEIFKKSNYKPKK